MNTAIQCIVLLACVVICRSTTIIGCRCLKTSRTVRLSLIRDAIEYNPRPHCNKKEVIVILKNKTSQCLDPNTKFTQAILRRIRKQKDLAAKRNATGLKTSTVSATVAATVSATVSDIIKAASIGRDLTPLPVAHGPFGPPAPAV